MESYLLDTCAVIKLLNETYSAQAILSLSQIIDQSTPILSFITKNELLCWNSPNPNDLKFLNEFVDRSTILMMNEPIINHTIMIRYESNYKIKLPDAIIAATVLVNNYTLVSDNEKDFITIPKLKLLNPKMIV